MFVSYNKNFIVQSVSEANIKIQGLETIEADNPDVAIGKKIAFGQKPEKLRIALICNWGDQCGISTYTENLVNALRPKLQELKIFSEGEYWTRGESMVGCIQAVKEWKPDLVFIQHEFGLFPRATHFLKMLELLNNMPYIITLHSVYEHLDKTICTAYIKNMIVHSEEGRNSLRAKGHLNNIFVIPHGCIQVDDNSELWNIFQNDHAIIQFGFGFNYKGVDLAIDAIHHLKQTMPKFNDIFYCYLCSESPHTANIQQNYYDYLKNKVDEAGLQENVTIVRGFLSDQHISNFLRTAKLAIFPYKNDETNVVYGASGAVRVAMANHIPVIASDCHLFDDLAGVVPRISNHLDLAKEIDKVFSNWKYKDALLAKNCEFVEKNKWASIADRHIEAFWKVVDDQGVVWIT